MKRGFSFKHAIVRKPGRNFSEGITASNLGRTDYETALRQHDAYCETLVKCGLELLMLEPDPRFPDCPFVEDTAVVTEKFALIMRPGHSKRRGEEDEIKEVLSRCKKLEIVESPGTADGGDILRVNDHFYIGLSERTNEEGAHQIESIMSKYGHTTSTITVENELHLKSAVNYLGNNNIVIQDAFMGLEEFEGLNKIIISENEKYAANCLLVNDFLLMPRGFPSAKENIRALDYRIIELNMTEFRKMDGGLTCLSIRY